MLKEAFFRGFVRRHGIESLGPQKYKRLMKGTTGGGIDSLVMVPVKWLSKKILGEKRHGRIGGSINKAIYDVDTIAGKPFALLTGKAKFTKNLFRQEELVPISKDKIQRIYRPSITAPFGHAKEIVVPMIAAGTISQHLERFKKGRKDEHGDKASSSENAPA